jgi:hypothetical protein
MPPHDSNKLQRQRQQQQWQQVTNNNDNKNKNESNSNKSKCLVTHPHVHFWHRDTYMVCVLLSVITVTAAHIAPSINNTACAYFNWITFALKRTSSSYGDKQVIMMKSLLGTLNGCKSSGPAFALMRFRTCLNVHALDSFAFTRVHVFVFANMFLRVYRTHARVCINRFSFHEHMCGDGLLKVQIVLYLISSMRVKQRMFVCVRVHVCVGISRCAGQSV